MFTTGTHPYKQDQGFQWKTNIFFKQQANHSCYKEHKTLWQQRSSRGLGVTQEKMLLAAWFEKICTVMGGLNLGSAGRCRCFSFEYPLMPSPSSFIFRRKPQTASTLCPQNEGIVSSAFFPAWSKFSYGRDYLQHQLLQGPKDSTTTASLPY